MAKGKGGKSVNKGTKGRKNHGPKTHIHHSIAPKALRQVIGACGGLSKYDDFDSWYLACSARGNNRATYNDFMAFVVLPIEQKRAYFANMKKKR